MPAEPFERIDVSAWDLDQDEPSGDEVKFWLIDSNSSPQVQWLFKTITAMPDVPACGEDWAEKIVSEVGGTLGVPCAHVELAVCAGRQGCISRSLRPAGYDLHPGALLLQDRNVPGYVPGPVAGRPGHSVGNIRQALDGVLPPPGSALPFEASGFDVFAGYLMLDALVANRDRHDENWAVLVPSIGTGPVLLCGSYDHANSLGYNPNDVKRIMYLERPGGVRGWCAKGTAHRLQHEPGKSAQTLVRAAAHALGLAAPPAKAHWLAQLEAVTDADLRSVVARVPELSDPARTFAAEVLSVNRERILDACA